MPAIQQPLVGADAHDADVQRVAQDWRYPVRGDINNAPILVLCEPPTINAARQSLPMEFDQLRLWAQFASNMGFAQKDFAFLGMCPPIPKSEEGSATKKWEYVSQYAEGAVDIIRKANPQMVVALGALPGRALMGKAVAAGKARGRFHDSKTLDRKYFQMISTKLVAMQPDNRPIMEADLTLMRRVREGNWDHRVLTPKNLNYYWCHDLSDLLENRPKVMALDSETTGLDTTAEGFRVITVQITTQQGETRVCRVCPDYYPDHELFAGQTEQHVARLRWQIKQLLEDPNIVKMMHGGKYDYAAFRSMGIEPTQWWDTELMARFVNENYMTFNLDDMTKIYVPEMGGYADEFNETVDKSNMMAVPPEDEYDLSGNVYRHGMRRYAGGDSDATFRLGSVLSQKMRTDPANLHVYKSIHHKALFAFSKSMETFGFTVDEEALQRFQDELGAWLERETTELTRLVPSKVRRKYLSHPKGFRLGSDDCMRAVLFSQDGFKLKPKVFTPATANDPDPEKRLPSVSSKDHMPYFLDAKGTAGEFVARYIELKKAQRIYDTYAKGFWKYIRQGHGNERRIVPKYNFKTNTKRSNSNDPNGQNFPKRGEFAKPFRRVFQASAGKTLVASDLSQAELRIAAWMAMEPEMIRIYNAGLDIHAQTAADTMGLSLEEFMALEKKERGLKRFQAKAVNFGYLYGARAPTFQRYAKTTFGVDYTIAEAEEIRDAFFARYKALLPWHERMKDEAHRTGAVRSLHGLTRHLHAIYSDDRMIMSGAERNAINSPVQNFGSDLGIIAFNRLCAQADPNLIRPVGFIHDQLIAEVDSGYVAEGMAWLKWIMENPPLERMFGLTPPLPIVSDPEYGQNLADTTELDDASDSMKAAVEALYGKPDWWDDDEESAWGRYVGSGEAPEHLLREVLFY